MGFFDFFKKKGVKKEVEKFNIDVISEQYEQMRKLALNLIELMKFAYKQSKEELAQEICMYILMVDCILDYLMKFKTAYMGVEDNYVDFLIDLEDEEIPQQKLEELSQKALKNWKDKCFFAPGIFMGAFPNDENIKDYKDLFYKNASLIINSLKFTTPLSLDIVWEKIVEYSLKEQ
jgi:hypothetical protein